MEKQGKEAGIFSNSCRKGSPNISAFRADHHASALENAHPVSQLLCSRNTREPDVNVLNYSWGSKETHGLSSWGLSGQSASVQAKQCVPTCPAAVTRIFSGTTFSKAAFKNSGWSLGPQTKGEHWPWPCQLLWGWWLSTPYIPISKCRFGKTIWMSQELRVTCVLTIKQPHSFSPCKELQIFGAQQALWVIQCQPETKEASAQPRGKKQLSSTWSFSFPIFKALCLPLRNLQGQRKPSVTPAFLPPFQFIGFEFGVSASQLDTNLI